ncbi:response regulator [Stutzerimonas stutzeri]|uniref:response regulator n=1 Tax=Stutzerimonas stutzeri TaxID=316 RepID=UPI0005EBCB2E|nr:response regulator [Stutzerimonas stutzeri]
MIDHSANTRSERSFEHLRVLVVEDEALVGMLLEDMLSDIGCAHVEVLSRFADGLQAAETGSFDLAVLDVNLDGVASFPIAEQLIARNIPLLFATGYGVDGMDPRFSDIPTLQKPFFFSDLERVVSQALEGA